MSRPGSGAMPYLIAKFNLLPSLELHPERRADYAPSAVWQACAKTPLGHRHLSRHILAAEQLNDDWVTAFETRERRIALLGTSALERMIMLTGLALNAHWIATSIDGREVAALRTKLGQSDYAFAVGRARFLGVSTFWPAPFGQRDLLDWFRRAGRAYLHVCLYLQPRPLRRRLELKLAPAPVGSEWLANEPPPEPKRAMGLLRKLARDMGPECASLLS